MKILGQTAKSTLVVRCWRRSSAWSCFIGSSPRRCGRAGPRVVSGAALGI
ncbi:MAG: hypothetical protein M0C28_47665 [Candidatus Moduliflexus flocculans]|nr:hypothetical protein [Candidatus Moduliflexus flocculans]